MSVVIITGSGGLIGSEAVAFFAELGMDVIGIENDMRRYFFGEAASVAWNNERLQKQYKNYFALDIDIRDETAISMVFGRYRQNIELIIHAAAQPSHDWSAKEPLTDFTINAHGTMILLEAARRHCPEAVFIFTSTNKVYGDAPNRLPLKENNTRWELPEDHEWFDGIPETMSIDMSLHSIFGASKVAADVLVQEYGRYFDMKTVSFRGGCLTGPNHSGVQLHGFLSYLMKCTVTGIPYTVFGYKGKQVRDNIHSSDLIRAFYHFYKQPRQGEVYNIGGGRHSNCSMLEGISFCEEIAGRELEWTYSEQNRRGDHMWWIGDLSKFQAHYPAWKINYDVYAILQELYGHNHERWKRHEPKPRFMG